MNDLILSHATAGHADQQLEAARLASIAADLRTIEVMFLDLQSVFDQCPEVLELSFDIEGDTDNMPMFSCVSPEGDFLAENPVLVETIAERWNANTLPVTAGFLQVLEGKTFNRHSFWPDVAHASKALQEKNHLSLSNEHMEVWMNSFVSHLKAQAMEQALPTAETVRKPRM